MNLRTLAFILSVFILHVSCGKRGNHADKQVFRYNEASGINSLDPAFARDKSSIWATNQLFNGLLQMDSNLNVQPCIAQHFEVDSSATHYIFYLRNDVWFHRDQCFGPDSNRPVTAEDFVFSFNRLKDPALASPGRWTMDGVADIWAESPTELHIKLKQPFPAFTGLLTMKYCSVVPEEAINFYGSAFTENPVGTGPFQFTAWHRNEKLVMQKNPRYFELDKHGQALPYLDAVSIRFITDQQAAFLEFLKGNIDLISGMDASYKDEIITPLGELKERYAENYLLQKQPYLNTEYLIFMVDTAQQNALDDSRLRQAINMGFDRHAMMAYLRNNIGRPATGGIIPFGLPGNIAEQGFQYNPEKAKTLIESLKNDVGVILPITLTTVANYRDLCEYIQSELGKLGLTVTVDVIPPANLRELKSQGALPFFRASWIADYPDAENYLSLFYGPNRSPNGPNYSRFYNATFDGWYEQARKSTNEAERILLYKKMDSLIVAEAPIVPLYYDEVVRIYPKSIIGLSGNGMNLLDLRTVKMP